MSTTYTSTIEVNVWKEHTCLHCGTVYRYLFKRTKTGQGATPDAAGAAAHNAVVKALASEVDMHPCTKCGSYQPDMIAAQRSSRHWWAFWLGLPVFFLVIILCMTDVLAASTGAYVMAITAALLFLWHLLLDVVNPNADLDANQRLALDREERGEIWVPRGKKGEGTGETVGSGVGVGHYIGYALLAVGLLLFVAPVGHALMTGAKINKGWNSEVVGPGDESYVYFNESINSIKGGWNGGTPQVTVTNLQEVGLKAAPQIRATTRADTWGTTITYKRSEGSNRSTLWTRLHFPDDDALAGKTLRVRIALTASYPQVGKPQLVGSNHTHDATITLSGKKAGATYRSLWWLGAIGGLSLTVLGGLALAMASSAFRAKALPTDIFVPDQDLPLDRDEDDRGRRDDVDHDEGGEDRYRLRDDDRNDDDRRRRDDDDDYRRRRDR